MFVPQELWHNSQHWETYNKRWVKNFELSVCRGRALKLGLFTAAVSVEADSIFDPGWDDTVTRQHAVFVNTDADERQDKRTN